MTIETTYIAWDDREFKDKYECLAYEKECQEKINTFLKAYRFYDKEMVEQRPPTADLKKIYGWISEQYYNCEYVQVLEEIQPEILAFITEYDWTVFPEHIGLYYYDLHGWALKA